MSLPAMALRLPTAGLVPTLAFRNLTRDRVRAEIDERDVGAVAPGQRASVTAEAFQERRYAARVAFVGLRFGRKQLASDDPAERTDTRVLEALLDLEADAPLIAGQRVDVLIDPSKTEKP